MNGHKTDRYRPSINTNDHRHGVVSVLCQRRCDHSHGDWDRVVRVGVPHDVHDSAEFPTTQATSQATASPWVEHHEFAAIVGVYHEHAGGAESSRQFFLPTIWNGPVL